MDLHKLGIKFFMTDPNAVPVQDFIPVFQSWIQGHAIPDHMLVDVHNYSHMHEGPGILLVAHEGNFSIDMTSGRPGLLYYRKAPTALPPVEHVATILRSALQARQLLEKDAAVRFSTEELLIIANDRLGAPNNETTYMQLQPIIAEALKLVFGGSGFRLTRWSDDPKQRFAV